MKRFNKVIPFIFTIMINAFYLMFGAALYIVSAAQAGLTLPHYINGGLLFAFAFAITLAEYSVRGVINLIENLKHANSSKSLPVDHHPSA